MENWRKTNSKKQDEEEEEEARVAGSGVEHFSSYALKCIFSHFLAFNLKFALKFWHFIKQISFPTQCRFLFIYKQKMLLFFIENPSKQK